MSPRRSLALTAGALLLGVPALSSCGFNYPTDRVNTITNGGTDRDETVYVLNAVVVSSRPESGTVIATFSNSSNREAVLLTSFSASNEGAVLETTTIGALPEEDTIGVFASGAFNLASDPVIRISGEFVAGDFVELSFGFDNGEQVVLEAPVVRACDAYDGLDVAPALETSEGVIPLPPYECGPPEAGEGVDAETGSEDGAEEGTEDETVESE